MTGPDIDVGREDVNWSDVADISRITIARRWFALVYLFAMFGLIPLFVFGLSMIGPLAMYIVLLPLAILLASVVCINLLQKHAKKWLPGAVEPLNQLKF